MNLSDRLRLSFDHLEISRGKFKKGNLRYKIFIWGIENSRGENCDDNLDKSCLENLNLEFERLREIMRAIIHKAIEEIINFYLQLESADEIY
ncbi:hypothetical protein Glove_79g74 [Diversispora epigaea]|uniref:Uncharacterized protein n=1 Tax=Diversispora epigaea TaxID=1348612 RepID=A0A397JF22_9GLOM|nr:hypothetical protein Glove_79g74 [Diversispora epigaea]